MDCQQIRQAAAIEVEDGRMPAGRLKLWRKCVADKLRPSECFIPLQKDNLTKYKSFDRTICVGRILESDVWPAAKAM